MRSAKCFKPSAPDFLEARDVPSAMTPDFLIRGGTPPGPPSHIYPVGVNTPYFIIQGSTPPGPPSHIYPVGVNIPYTMAH